MSIKRLAAIGAAVLVAALTMTVGLAGAGTYTTGFESFALGTVNGQEGWHSAMPGDIPALPNGYDQAVVDTSGFGSPSGFGSQALRVSNAYTNGEFFYQTYSPSVSEPAGETQTNTVFDGQFQFVSTSASEQPGLFVSVSPDNGVGARMSYVSLEDTSSGIHITFYETDPSGQFVSYDAGTYARDVVHTVRFLIQTVAGPANDVARLFIDGTDIGNELGACFTTWEQYYRVVEDGGHPPGVINSFEFRNSGAAAPGLLGGGYLFDNVSTVTRNADPPAPTTCVTTQTSVATMNVGQTKTVGDTATLTDVRNPTGDVSFQLYSDAACSNPVAGVSGSAAPDTSGVATFAGASFTPTSTGTYYWGVTYPGDIHNYPASACGGPNEEIVVDAALPTIATLLSDSSITVGGAVHDSSTLTAAAPDAGGTVKYRYYASLTACQAGSYETPGGTSAGDKTVTGGVVPDSDSATFNSAGTYYWRAFYSGDDNNQAALSACTDEKLVVTPLIDLAVTKVGSPNPITVGQGDITWTMAVTNNGPSTATGVTISDPLPAGTTFVSLSTTQGSCTSGAIIQCKLGTMAAGATVTITLVTTPTVAGTVSNTATVVGNEAETNTANNTATTSVAVKGFKPPVFCVAVSKVTPKQLFVGRKTMLKIHVTQHGKAVKGIHVRIKGPKVNVRTRASNSKGVIKHTLKMKKAGVLVFTPIASKTCNTKRVGVTNVFTPPVTG